MVGRCLQCHNYKYGKIKEAAIAASFIKNIWH